MKTLLNTILVLLLFSCGSEKLPKQIDDTIDITKRTNENVEESNAKMAQTNEYMGLLLSGCYNMLFKHDIANPLEKNNSPYFSVQYNVFNSKKLSKEASFLDFNRDNLEVYYDEVEEKPYFVVPKIYHKIIPENSVKMVEIDGTICNSINEILKVQMERITDEAVEYFKENEDAIFDKLGEMTRKIEEAKIDCGAYEAEQALQDYYDQKIKWWQFKKKKKLKERKKREEFYKIYAPHPCEKEKTAFILESFNSEEAKELIDKNWNSFRNRWSQYYLNWEEDKKNIFTQELAQNIAQLNLTQQRARYLYEIGRKDQYKKLGLLNAPGASLIVPYNAELEKLRKFLSNNEKSMRVDKNFPTNYDDMPEDRLLLLQQIFKRYYYSGNSKDERVQLRYFIADAQYMLYELQLLETQIELKTKALLSEKELN